MASIYGLKIPKSEKPDKGPFTLYNNHETKNSVNRGFCQIVSIDPATKNYALRIERRYDYGRIDTVTMDRTSIADPIDSEICHIFDNLNNFLDRFLDHFRETDLIIIERQLPENYKATRIAQHTISYFLLKLKDSPLTPTIVEISPQLKGKILGAPKGIGKRELKKWAIEEADRLLRKRGDTYGLDLMKSIKGKKDDLADTLCQIEAYFLYLGLPGTTEQAPRLDIKITVTEKPKIKIVPKLNIQIQK